MRQFCQFAKRLELYLISSMKALLSNIYIYCVKRFPAHAAVALCCMEEIKRLLTEDAPFHVVRKIPDVELSVLHSACSLRQGAPKSIFPDLVKYLIQVSNK